MEYKGYTIEKNEQGGLPKSYDYEYYYEGEPVMFASSIDECKKEIDEINS